MNTDPFNPITRALVQQLHDPDLAEFAHHWDALEALVIRTFRNSRATREDEAAWRRVNGQLKRIYAWWRDALAGYWPQVKAGGEPVQEDPFAWLLDVKQASDLIGNWRAMQTLPAAREALNRYLMDRVEQA